MENLTEATIVVTNTLSLNFHKGIISTLMLSYFRHLRRGKVFRRRPSDASARSDAVDAAAVAGRSASESTRRRQRHHRDGLQQGAPVPRRQLVRGRSFEARSAKHQLQVGL